ncbi:MAG: hypothetical protein A2022_10175 [Deltaproteobacteria bacterium GWF2_42_12]|nr:MAG: hypothetical protein A2022_10175 [Deltaproteobacteria bacterium GWF2_42_12]
MYRIPKELDLSKIVGQFTTQIRVGQFDLQFSFGEVHFAIQSCINLVRNGEIIGKWQEGKWPPPQFFEIMNVDVTRYEIPNDRTIVVHLENGMEIQLSDDSDQFECMQISIKGEPNEWII